MLLQKLWTRYQPVLKIHSRYHDIRNDICASTSFKIRLNLLLKFFRVMAHPANWLLNKLCFNFLLECPPSHQYKNELCIPWLSTPLYILNTLAQKRKQEKFNLKFNLTFWHKWSQVTEVSLLKVPVQSFSLTI